MEIYLICIVIGLVPGLIMAFGAWKEKRRLEKALGTRVEVENKAMKKLNDELEKLRKENENLRIRVQKLSDKSGGQDRRTLEVYERIREKLTLMYAAAGFAQAWELVKTEAVNELAEEDAGKTLPNRFRSWIGLSTPKRDALPDVRQD